MDLLTMRGSAGTSEFISQQLQIMAQMQAEQERTKQDPERRRILRPRAPMCRLCRLFLSNERTTLYA